MKKLLLYFLLLSNCALSQEFNIVNYGAVPNDALPDDCAIQSAINAAVSNIGGGKVVIGLGRWIISKADTLKSNMNTQQHVTIECETGARFIMPSGYTGSMWYVNGKLEGFRLVGGSYYGTEPNSRLWTFLDLNSPDLEKGVSSNFFRDVFVYDVGTGIKLTGTGTGWVNANSFEDFNITNFVSAIKMRRGPTSAGVDGNYFSNMQLQANTMSMFCLDSLSGNSNIFNNLFVWDFNVTTNPQAAAIILNANSNYNQITGSEVSGKNYKNLGVNNTVNLGIPYWDRMNFGTSSYNTNSNNRMGLGTKNPITPLHVFDVNSTTAANQTLTLESGNPGIVEIVARASGGFAYPLFTAKGKNTTTNLTGAATGVGVLGNMNSGTTAPTIDYLYFGTDYNDNALRVYSNKVVNITKRGRLTGMTKAERDVLPSKTAGDFIYQTDNVPGLRFYNGVNWIRYTEITD